MNATYGRMIMCHMIADTPEELRAMASTIDVNSRWLQHRGTYQEHFDICLSKKAKAVAAGAIEITWSELGRKVAARNPKRQKGASNG